MVPRRSGMIWISRRWDPAGGPLWRCWLCATTETGTTKKDRTTMRLWWRWISTTMRSWRSWLLGMPRCRGAEKSKWWRDAEPEITRLRRCNKGFSENPHYQERNLDWNQEDSLYDEMKNFAQENKSPNEKALGLWYHVKNGKISKKYVAWIIVPLFVFGFSLYSTCIQILVHDSCTDTINQRNILRPIIECTITKHKLQHILRWFELTL